MSWNYRIVKTSSGGEDEFGIHEVYYDNHGNLKSYSEDPVSPLGSTLEELKGDFSHFQVAFEKPVLTPDDFLRSQNDEEFPV